MIQLAMMCRVSRQVLELPDVDPLLSSPEADRPVGESPQKRLNMSTVIDQLDETEVPTPSRSQVDINHENPHRYGRGGATARSSAMTRANRWYGREN